MTQCRNLTSCKINFHCQVCELKDHVKLLWCYSSLLDANMYPCQALCGSRDRSAINAIFPSNTYILFDISKQYLYINNASVSESRDLFLRAESCQLINVQYQMSGLWSERAAENVSIKVLTEWFYMWGTAGGFSSQGVNNAESVFMSLYHHRRHAWSILICWTEEWLFGLN